MEGEAFKQTHVNIGHNCTLDGKSPALHLLSWHVSVDRAVCADVTHSSHFEEQRLNNIVSKRSCYHALDLCVYVSGSRLVLLQEPDFILCGDPTVYHNCKRYVKSEHSANEHETCADEMV